MTRLPLAFRVSPVTSRAVVRRAAESGIDPDDAAAMGALVGALVTEGLPTVVADVLVAGSGSLPRRSRDLGEPSGVDPHVLHETAKPGPQPGSASEFLTTSPSASVADPATDRGATRRARP